MKNDVFGYIAGLTSSVMFFPQIIKIYRTKSSADISYATIFVSNISSMFLLWYSIDNSIMPFVVSAAISLSSRMIVLLLKCYYDRAAQLPL